MSSLKKLYHRVLYPEYKFGWDLPTERSTERPTAPEIGTYSKWDDTVTVLVGAEKTPFQCSTKQLFTESAYFKTALGPTWNKEGKTEAVLEDISEDIFKLIFTWFSQERVYSYSSSRENYAGRHEYWLQMVRLYVAAEFLMMPKLMNAIVDVDACEHRDYNFKDSNGHGKAKHIRFWTLETLIEALDLGVKDTPYYNFMLDSCVYGMRYGKQQDDDIVQQQLAGLQDQYPEVMLDLTRRSLRKDGNNWWKEPNPWFNHFRDYHVHAKGVECGGSLGI